MKGQSEVTVHRMLREESDGTEFKVYGAAAQVFWVGLSAS